ncbi:transmembrane 9 superfamily member 4-like [Symsagittifera roscoffensis]|uniref:transmembrane 9 superfamily member 4-like n=1 Tax=Symsagittifera roscoffensis TaxID=84072 RepID=UPI00307B1F85
MKHLELLIVASLSVVLFCTRLSDCFVVPGVAPMDYLKDDPVEIKAVKLTSDKAQLPYEYYSLPFCKPSGNNLAYKSENLGEILRGDRIVNTPYDIKFMSNLPCKVLCGADKELSSKEVAKLVDKIQDEYSAHLMADGLPVATPYKNIHTRLTEYEIGYKVGSAVETPDKKLAVALNNYLQFVMKYHFIAEENTYRIVGFEVFPRSVSLEDMEIGKEGQCSVKNQEPKPLLLTNSDQKIVFAYEVEWEESVIKWASRWDVYLARKDGQIHWFNILNALIIVLLMSGIVTVILIRTLRRDIAKYNSEDDLESHLEESGWKMVHGDVFRPPKHPRLLSSLVGSGIQILAMFGFTIGLAMLGFLSPASRGSIMSGGIFLYCFMGVIAGYHAGRLYRTMRGQQWKSGAMWTGTLFPGILFGTTFFLNFFIWGKKSSGAVPFSVMVSLLAIWLGISLPLVFLGYYFGFRKQPYSHPVQVKHIPRVVPEQSWHNHPFIAMVLSGLLPFGAVFLELSFIFTAIWKHEYYSLFAFLFLVFLILIVTTSQVAIIVIYFQLCNEDYNWWWRSFLTSCGPAFYLFLYSIIYFYFRLDITEFIPALLYFGYSMLMVASFALLTGAIGFISAYFFIRKIYGAVKID